MNLERSLFLIMGGRMELGVVVTHVLFAWCPINEEVFLFSSISNTIKPHVCGFLSALFDGFIDDV